MARDERGRASVPAGDTPRQPRLSAWGRSCWGVDPALPATHSDRSSGFTSDGSSSAFGRRSWPPPRLLSRPMYGSADRLDPALQRGLVSASPWCRRLRGWPPAVQRPTSLRRSSQSNGVYGLAFLVSVAVGRPLAGVFAQETYPFPPEVKASHTFRSVFSRISLVWATYLLLRAGLRFFALLRSSVEFYLVIQCRDGYSVHRCAHELVDLVRRAELPTKREGVGAIPHWSLTVFGAVAWLRPAPAQTPSSGSSQLGRVVA